MSSVKYTAGIEWDPGEELYIVTVPALSLGSYGATGDEAMEMAKEAIEVTIEGLKSTGQPVPVSVSAL